MEKDEDGEDGGRTSRMWGIVDVSKCPHCGCSNSWLMFLF